MAGDHVMDLIVVYRGPPAKLQMVRLFVRYMEQCAPPREASMARPNASARVSKEALDADEYLNLR